MDDLVMAIPEPILYDSAVPVEYLHEEQSSFFGNTEWLLAQAPCEIFPNALRY